MFSYTLSHAPLVLSGHYKPSKTKKMKIENHESVKYFTGEKRDIIIYQCNYDSIKEIWFYAFSLNYDGDIDNAIARFTVKPKKQTA